MRNGTKLTTLAIINLAVAAALITETADEQSVQDSTEVVAVVDTATTSNELSAKTISE